MPHSSLDVSMLPRQLAHSHFLLFAFLFVDGPCGRDEDGMTMGDDDDVALAVNKAASGQHSIDTGTITLQKCLNCLRRSVPRHLACSRHLFW